MKTLVQKHLLTIVCALSLILLLLPLAKISAEVDIGGYGGASQTVSVSGLKALDGVFFAYFLFLGPALLIAMNYIKPLEKYRGLIALVVPALCLVCLILTVIQAKKFGNAASYGNVEVSVGLGIGAILEILTYIGMAVAGLITYHNFTLDKAGLEKLKAQGGNLVGAAKSKVSAKKEGFPSPAPAAQQAAEIPAPAQVAAAPFAVAPAAMAVSSPTVSVDRAEEVLALIERLAKMKDGGILTDDEFSEKKRQLLKEI